MTELTQQRRIRGECAPPRSPDRPPARAVIIVCRLPRSTGSCWEQIDLLFFSGWKTRCLLFRSGLRSLKITVSWPASGDGRRRKVDGCCCEGY
ncbi:hypothetical protein PVAP13_4NG300300 [Panicum virgatum]|uniref:Uncharacterized protein n=1 Tax=Panicum virgatum TaxID=38727 RepID=A0A8T0TDY2_PANVG|nr:hypothetical protein PVAP13_4NG300300 [Panicum virgatum]